MRIQLKLVIALLLTLFSLQAFSYQPDAYSQPISYGDFVKDIEQTLRRGIKRNNWTLNKEQDNQYTAQISHKGYVIKVTVELKDNQIHLKNKTVSRSKGRVDHEKVESWLVRLRRTIAYEITVDAVRDAQVQVRNAY